jgi:import inner membrane translocase subunit TIM10
MTSIFGRPQASLGGGGGINSERLEAATVELEMVSDMFNRLVRSCHAKCIDRHYLEETLNKGEGVCADRCGK